MATAQLLKNNVTPRLNGAYTYSELSVNAKINYKALFEKSNNLLFTVKDMCIYVSLV